MTGGGGCAAIHGCAVAVPSGDAALFVAPSLATVATAKIFAQIAHVGAPAVFRKPHESQVINFPQGTSPRV